MKPFDFARNNVPLAPLTLYNVGGPARQALFPRNIEEAVAGYAWMAAQPDPKLVLGRGSNVLVADAGFEGIVFVTTKLDWITSLGDFAYDVGAGTELGQLVREVMLPNNFTGVGALAGIPGSVGGAMYMNAGTVNGSTCEMTESAELVGPGGRRTVRVTPELYGYRGQRFCPPDSLILSGRFVFREAEEDQEAVYDHYIGRRRTTQPQGYCCGSVFKNPEGGHAGRMIEACGLKGTRRGGAVISPLHANFIMNEEHATAADIVWLIDLCRKRVLDAFNILLETEVVLVGRHTLPERP